ncbi:ABC transporter ATP-binding protein [Knoellia subterranea]|uniref:ABC transporter ATP-binding protein n=1 Tax=Knoellia subterranea KCTC 19937 TaxID=1385521 RepID=A0A0A0JRE1_9MICO|nr:ATP-binding cassette domain-containing protein [Knoellia subterranea]KGN39294.1 ABC transporter ATP-binding protein [Knoellia subterranea KCTC 19937]
MGKHSERGHADGVGRAATSPGATDVHEVVVREVVVREVVVNYGDVTALKGVSLTASAGEFVAITGHSGAGKTTLINAIGGIVPFAGGSVALGQNGHGPDPSAVAIIPQGNGLASILTAYENVLAPLRARRVPADAAASRAQDALASVGLGESGSHLVEELSGGQQQRAAVARGLALDATVLLADEPTSELDHDNRERVLGLLRAKADGGAIVIMTTHDPEAAERADRVIELDDGEVVHT